MIKSICTAGAATIESFAFAFMALFDLASKDTNVCFTEVKVVSSKTLQLSSYAGHEVRNWLETISVSKGFAR